MLSWRGVLYCFLWYYSIVCGFFTLCCPATLLLLFSHKLYRHALDLIFATWELYPVGLMEVLMGTETVVSGDRVRPWERSVLVMNHRTRLDWNFLWGAMHYATQPQAHRLKFILKAAVRHMPGPGWVMQQAGFFYIHRDWNKDKQLISTMIDYYKDLDHTYQVLIFPEGTDLTKSNVKKSNDYADKHNLPYYSRVLHPKTRGFAHLVNSMRSQGQLDAVYDLTVGYASNVPEKEQDMLHGIFPSQTHFYIKRYGVEELPEREEGLKEWLTGVWSRKEEALTEFYREGCRFGVSRAQPWPRPLSNALHLGILFWSLDCLLTTALLLLAPAFRLYCLLVTVLFLFLSFTSEGVQHLEVLLFRVRSYTKKVL